jgi:hypothetical protein
VGRVTDKGRKAWLCPAVCWTGALLGGLQADHKEKDETLDAETASGIVERSLQYTETGQRVDRWPQSNYRGQVTVL